MKIIERCVASALLLAMGFLAPPRSLAQTSVTGSDQRDHAAGRAMMDFHSGFWINLHHFLYEQAAAEGDLPKPTRHEPLCSEDANIASSLSADEQRVWSYAIHYYQANVISRDLLSNDAMRIVKNRLEDLESAPTLVRSRLDPPLAAVLSRAAPVYRAHWWPAHDRANRAWIDSVKPLVEQHGAALAAQLSTAFGTLWPQDPVRVDVVAYANWAGAYTTLRPARIAVSSLDARNQGTAALEILFHEASHALIENVGNTLIRDFAAHRKTTPRDLWHAILFFTAGYYVQQLYPDYTPYADRNGLWQHGFSLPYQAVLVTDWQPRLEGKVALARALSRVAADLSEEAVEPSPGSARPSN